MAIHRTASEMTGSHIGIYVSMGRNFPQGDTQKSVWDEIPWARTHKGNHVGRGELIILVLTRDDGVPI